ncbi:uncharacterized protein LOC102700555 [Oryza brachyantha]|uniref:uncharacterized protein LOC102700555 n=1 Tax=Oryza brachyantha TaxID=4533 RepID=UPI001AD96CCF|nr:uncharacterized protein LOC102700555 [Oryza brachyantha]
MDPKEETPPGKPTTGGGGGSGGGPPPPPRRKPDCIKCFDALWFCYSPFYQMQYYYRYGEFDNCFGKWGDLVDCLVLRTKRAAEVDEILAAREKARPHIWTYRTVDEASDHWLRMYRHLVRPGEESDHHHDLVTVVRPRPPPAAPTRPAPFPGLADAVAAAPRPPPPKSGGAS